MTNSQKKTLNKMVLVTRIKLIEKYLGRLKEAKKLSKGRFALDDNIAIVSYNLRSALEATFDICSHILARIPGAQIDEYKKMAAEMSKQNIVSEKFAKNNLSEMAGYRNRLTHFYFEVSPKEMYEIVQNDLNDFDIFLKHIKKFLIKQEK